MKSSQHEATSGSAFYPLLNYNNFPKKQLFISQGSGASGGRRYTYYCNFVDFAELDTGLYSLQGTVLSVVIIDSRDAPYGLWFSTGLKEFEVG